MVYLCLYTIDSSVLCGPPNFAIWFLASVHFSSRDPIKTEQPIRHLSLTNYFAVEPVPDLNKHHSDFANLTQPYNHLKSRLTGLLNIKMSLKDNREVMCRHLVLSKHRLFDNKVAAGLTLLQHRCRTCAGSCVCEGGWRQQRFHSPSSAAPASRRF